MQKITAKLNNSEIGFAEQEGFSFRNIIFTIKDSLYSSMPRVPRGIVYIRCTMQTDELKLDDIKDLFNLLLDREILYK